MKNEGKISYWYYPEKGVKFENRKEVKKFVGGNNKFNKLFKEKRVVYALLDDKNK